MPIVWLTIQPGVRFEVVDARDANHDLASQAVRRVPPLQDDRRHQTRRTASGEGGADPAAIP